MIGVRLMGGLGNQMFQYAAAASLAHRRHTTVTMDMVFFDNIADVDTPRHYELDCFNIRASVLDPARRPVEDEAAYLGKRGLLRLATHRAQGKAWHTYREPHHHYDHRLMQQPDRTYLIGYWQTERYFRDIRGQLLRDFCFANEPSVKNAKLLDRIKGSDAISVHVRRGDYVSNKHANAFHGTKDLKYYQAALQPILKNSSNPTLFVFSDDPAWCKQNLRFSQPTVYVEGNDKGYEDMRLMMHCKHNIIANSSFSWWAAWLNQNENKVIVAPKHWFNDSSVNPKDIAPLSWLQI